MFTSTCASIAIARSGNCARAAVASSVNTRTNWYAPGMDAFLGFEHKHPSRRPPSLT